MATCLAALARSTAKVTLPRDRAGHGSAKTRDRILETARDLFNEDGVALVSTNRIAAELGISQGNLHYHFKKKEDLVTWLVRRFREALRPLIEAQQSVQALDDLWLLMHLTLEEIDRHRFVLREMDFLLREYPNLRTQLRTFTEERRAGVHRLLHRLRSVGVVDATDEQLGALALQTVLTTTAWHAFEHLSPAATDAQSGSRALAYHLLILLSPYVQADGRPYLNYLRARYGTACSATGQHGTPASQSHDVAHAAIHAWPAKGWCPEARRLHEGSRET